MPDTHFQPTYSIETHEADPRRPWFNLRRLLVLLVLLGAAPLLVNELLSYQRQRLDRVESTRRSIDALAEVVADSSAQMARGVGRLLTAVAVSPLVLADDPPACSRYFKRLLSQQPDFLNFGLVGLDGRVVCEATGVGGNAFLGDRDYFKRALEGELLTVGAHQVGRITGRNSVVFARPVVQEGGKVKGVLFGAMDLKSLAGSLRGAGAVPGAAVHLVDVAGVVLASTGEGVSPDSLPLTDTVLRDAIRARRTGRVAEPGGEEAGMLRSLQPVNFQGTGALYVAVAVPTARVVAAPTHDLEFRLAVLVVIALTLAAIAWVLGERLIVRPVERLINALRHVQTGDYARALRQPVAPLRELDELQRSLGSLVTSLVGQRFERDEALGALSEREARYRELFSANPQAMYVYDIQSLRFLAVNEAATVFYGYTHEEFMDLTVLDIRPAWEREPLLARLSRLGSQASGGEVRRVWTHQKKNGETRQVEVIYQPTVFEGHAAELVMVSDVTARLTVEAQVRALYEKLEYRVTERTQELEASNRELEAFSYSVSHDLRNPLGAVGMFGQMLSAHLGETADEQAQLYLARIEKGVRGMEQLIDDLLALAQVTRARLEVVEVDLTALCRDVVSALRELDPAREVEVTLDDGLSCEGDAGLLRRLMDNLIGNAWKFTARTPGARIHIGRQTEDVAGGAAVFFVRDNGAGFDMTFASRLFLPFERLHGEHEFTGTGIGLATARRIVARHHGRIWAEAAVGQGATLRFTLGPFSAGA